MSFSTIPIKTTIPTPGTSPASASAFIVSSIDEVNTLEITGECSAGSGSLILVRYFADLDEWRPWHEDRPLTVDSAVRDGLFSGVYPIPKGSEAFVLYDSTAAITATVKARRTSSPDEATVASSSSAPLPTGAATSAKQDTGNTSLASILGQLDNKTSTLATQTTVAAILAQLDSKTSTLATQTTSAAVLAQLDNKTSTLATQATATAIATSLTDGNQKTQVTSSTLPTGAAKDSTLTDGSALLRLTSDKSNVAAVQNTAPTTEYGIVTRNIPSGTQTVSGTVTVASTTANQGTGAGAALPWSFELSDGAAFYTGAKTGQFPTTLGQTTKAASLSVAIASDQTVPISAASLPLPSGAATEATLALLPVAQASTTAGESGPLMQGAVTTAAPTYTTGKTNPLSLTTAGALRTDASATTQPVSQAIASALNATVVQGAGSGAAGTYWYARITDGTNTTPTMDAVGRAGFQKITDGTNTMPTMDAAARKGFQAVTDGTNTATVKASSTPSPITDTAISTTPRAFSFTHIGSAATVNIKASRAALGSVAVNYTSIATSITLYNDAAGGTTNPIASITVPAGVAPFVMNWNPPLDCTNGLTYATTGASQDFTVGWL